VIKVQTAQLTEFRTEMTQFKIETAEKLDQILGENGIFEKQELSI
jgi:hypothetical protein